MAKASRRTIVKIVVRLLHDRPSERSTIVRSLAAYLALHKQTNQLDLFMYDVARELEISEGNVLAEVTSAFALDDAAKTAVQAYLKQATGACSVELTEHINKDLLSGLLIRTADRELDLSARRQLQQLARLNSGGNE